MVSAFEGNKAETKTMLPVIESFMAAHDLPDVTVIAVTSPARPSHRVSNGEGHPGPHPFPQRRWQDRRVGPEDGQANGATLPTHMVIDLSALHHDRHKLTPAQSGGSARSL
jgi:hypothetical protein